MSIDEAINYLKALKRCETCEESECKKSCECYRIGSSAKCYDAIDTGLAIMYKYRKIEDIVNKWNDDENAMILAGMIKEIIENGSN